MHGGNLESRLKSSTRLSRLIFNNTYALVAPSNFLKSTFENYGFNNVQFIPNTIKIEAFQFQNKSIDTIALLWVRSFSKIYNPEMAIRVLQGLTNAGVQTKLTMVGPDADGSLDRVKALATAHNLEVNFTGKLSRREWVDLSQNSNIFINTTNFDNMPVSVIEAMALGIPVVSTNVGGLSYLIEDEIDGILVEANDDAGMVKAIIRLKDDKQLKDKLITNARNKVENFDWKVVKPMWESLLR